MNSLPIHLREFAAVAYAHHPPSHNLEHAERVYENACQIVSAEGLTLSETEQKLLPYVMIGHDFRDYKMLAYALSASEIEAFYTTHLGEHLARILMHMHENCSWSKRGQSEKSEYETLRLLLQDADWLEALGKTGLRRCIQYKQETGAEVPGAVCQLIRQKLLLIPAALNFASSRMMAQKLLSPLNDYLAQHEKCPE